MDIPERATFAGGCFWCTEAIFKRIKGVIKVTSGYAGDGEDKPTYEQVSNGNSGYFEAVQIEFDPKITPYTKLLEIFFKTHDPTSFDRQGADTGTQYRSVVFYHNSEQKKIIEGLVSKFEEEKIFSKKIVTEIKPFNKFFEAEPYHKNFYDRNRDYPYCTVVINPKIEKLISEFGRELKAMPSN